MDHPVILFDGVCNFCNGMVNFAIRNDKSARFRFAALQSDAGRAISSRFGIAPDDLSSFLLIENGKIYRSSTAALRVARKLAFPVSLLYGFIIVPKALRDAVYGWIAKNRIKWFGKKDSCMIPTPELRARFL